MPFSDHCLMSMKLKICYDNETDEPICEAQAHLPDKFLWSEEANIKY